MAMDGRYPRNIRASCPHPSGQLKLFKFVQEQFLGYVELRAILGLFGYFLFRGFPLCVNALLRCIYLATCWSAFPKGSRDSICRSDDCHGWNDKKQFYPTDVSQPYFSLVGKVSKRTPRSFGLRHTARDTLFLKLIRAAQTVNCSCINGIHAIHGIKSASCLVVLFGRPWPQPDKLLTEKEHRARSQSDGEIGCQIRI
jgi:hypothetical protein